MSMDVRILHVPDFLQTNAYGVPDLKATEQMLGRVAQQCVTEGVNHVLLDIRDANGRLLSVADVYSIARRFHEMGFNHEHKLAIVNKPKGDFDGAAFLELCAGNRGWQVRAFRKIEPALDWLAAG